MQTRLWYSLMLEAFSPMFLLRIQLNSFLINCIHLVRRRKASLHRRNAVVYRVFDALIFALFCVQQHPMFNSSSIVKPMSNIMVWQSVHQRCNRYRQLAGSVRLGPVRSGRRFLTGR